MVQSRTGTVGGLPSLGVAPGKALPRKCAGSAGWVRSNGKSDRLEPSPRSAQAPDLHDVANVAAYYFCRLSERRMCYDGS